MKIVTFGIGAEIYAVELAAVESVGRAGETPGVTAEVASLDLVERFGGETGERGRAEVAVRTSAGEARLQVERLGEVLDASGVPLQPVPRFFDRSLVRGVLPMGDRLVILLDTAALVSAARAAVA